MCQECENNIRRRVKEDLNLWSPTIQGKAEDALNLGSGGMEDFLVGYVMYAMGLIETPHEVERNYFTVSGGSHV